MKYAGLRYNTVFAPSADIFLIFGRLAYFSADSCIFGGFLAINYFPAKASKFGG